jgi:hypothetical protein
MITIKPRLPATPKPSFPVDPALQARRDAAQLERLRERDEIARADRHQLTTTAVERLGFPKTRSGLQELQALRLTETEQRALLAALDADMRAL